MAWNSEITQLLENCWHQDEGDRQKLLSIVYDELYRRSVNAFRGEKPGHTLQPTALIGEAYIRLEKAGVEIKDRVHFFALASTMMRRVLLDHAKAKLAQRRGGNQLRVTLNEDHIGQSDDGLEMLDLARALEQLRENDSRKADLVDYFYFGGLTVEEIYQLTGLSTATIGRDLRFARAWLQTKLTEES